MPEDITIRPNTEGKPNLNIANRVTNFFLALILSLPNLAATGAVTGTSGYLVKEVLKEIDQTEELINFIRPKAQKAATEIQVKFKQAIDYLESADKTIPLSDSLKMLGRALAISGAAGGTTGAIIHALRLVRAYLVPAIQETNYSDKNFWEPTFELYDIFNLEADSRDYKFEAESDIPNRQPVESQDANKVYNFNERLNQFIEKLEGNPVFYNKTVTGPDQSRNAARDYHEKK